MSDSHLSVTVYILPGSQIFRHFDDKLLDAPLLFLSFLSGNPNAGFSCSSFIASLYLRRTNCALNLDYLCTICAISAQIVHRCCTDGAQIVHTKY